VAGIVRVGSGTLDVEYPRRWAVTLGVGDLLERALGQPEH
jgi:hypothetical protein